MARTGRTLMQSIVSPVISTSLYFVVFGAAIGSRITEIEGVSYGAFIVPGLIMLTAADAERRQRLVRHLLPEVRRHHLRAAVGADLLSSRSCSATSARRRPSRSSSGSSSWPPPACSCRSRSQHPVWMLAFLVLTAVTFSLFGFIIGIWADGFEKLQVIPLLIITPLTFLGGTLLFDQRAAAVLADGHAVQSGRLSDQRLPLELLRHRRRGRRHQPRHDAGCSWRSASASCGGSSGPAIG